MKVTLHIDELVENIKARYLMETRGLEGVSSSPISTVNVIHCLNVANSMLTTICDRFVTDVYQEDASNVQGVEESYIYEFSVTERRFIGGTQGLADLMHEYLVNMSLSQIYSGASMNELANKDMTEASNIAQALSSKLFIKKSPSL